MSELVTDCPRCASKRVTFTYIGENRIEIPGQPEENPGTALYKYETFCVCRICKCASVFMLKPKRIGRHVQLREAHNINGFYDIDHVINLINNNVTEPPEHLPEEINRAFLEGARCYATDCYNAAATMMRLCIDLATKPLLPPIDPSEASPNPNKKIRRDLGLRLKWLFDNDLIPSNLKDLASCIREDGNDGAHAGTLSKEDADDIIDFTKALLDRLITENKRIEPAEARRAARRQPPSSA